MVIKANKFTPEVLLSAPRRSAGVPNPSATYVLFTSATYSFKDHKRSLELKALEVKTGESYVLAKDDNISDVNWLDDDEFVCLQAEKDGTTSVYWSSISQCLEKVELGRSHYITGTIAGPASTLKIARRTSDTFAIIVAAEASPDGSVYNAEKAKSLRSTGRLYTSLFVRHWDRYETKEKNTLFYGTLTKHAGKYQLSKLTNALKNTHLECPIRPFGGADHFDISANRIIFVAKDPTLNPALSTKTNVYLVTVKSWDTAPDSVELIDIGGGAKTSPVFSTDGTKAAFLGMSLDGYEADQNRIYVISDVKVSSASVLDTDERTFWDRSPGAIRFTRDDSAILAIAEDHGHGKLFYLPLDPSGKVHLRVLTQHGTVSDFVPLADGKTFTSSSTLIDNSVFGIVGTSDLAIQDRLLWTHSNTAHGKLGLHKEQISEIWTPASNTEINEKIHSWVVKPSDFDSSKRYPVAYLIHGGPQAAWQNSWSTRWNLAVFAEQGYIVVAPNPTGSTGYGQKFVDAIAQNWGGDPYEDIVKVFDWVEENMKEADNNRAVALGASYGGYMVNWIQGHDLGRKFKALVCHDGIFSTVNELSTDELYFIFKDLGGTTFYDPQNPSRGNAKALTYPNWRQWDPSEHLDAWSTPELVIHSAKDFRLPISEGLAAFNVLQTKGIESEFLTFPEENHWVLKPENSLVWHKVVLNWINKHVGLPAYTNEDPASEEFYGGVAEESETQDMPTSGPTAI